MRTPISAMSKDQQDLENELGQRLRLISDSEEDERESNTSKKIRPIFNGLVIAVLVTAAVLFFGTQINEHIQAVRNQTSESELEARNIWCESYERYPNGTYNVTIKITDCPPYKSSSFNFVRAVTILITNEKVDEVIGVARFGQNKNEMESLPKRQSCDVVLRLQDENGTLPDQWLMAVFRWQAVNIAMGVWESKRAILPINFNCNTTNVV